MSSSERRFAIYYVPPESAPLTQAAAAWLGWDALAGKIPMKRHLNGLEPETWRGVTESPRIYGFHATLKPPFRLATGAREDDLRAAFESFAARQTAFPAPRFKLSSIGSFLALTLTEPSPNFEALAAAAVTEFDGFRAAPPADELERRKKASLSPRQLELLSSWGYPYVLDEWRFHMTLSSSLGPELRDEILVRLAPTFEPLCSEPFLVDSICLFEQLEANAPFRCVLRAGLS